MPRRLQQSQSSPMQLTRAADYALRALIFLAQQPEGHRAPLGELSRATGTPESFLSKVLQSLVRTGFVTSRRGQAGGFTLLPRGRDASIAAVIESIDGPCSLNLCLSNGVSCDRRSHCPAHPIWAEAQNAMMQVLCTHSIGELATRAPAFPNSLVQF
jgi:Rrf2 family protein